MIEESFSGDTLEIDADDEMARKPRSTAPLNAEAVARHVSALKAARIDRASFDEAFARVLGDQTVGSAELIAIANSYAIGGSKTATRQRAIDRIKKRFVELVRTAANVRVAEKARPF